MKSQFLPPVKSPIDYPVLMVAKRGQAGMVVLFTDKYTGTVVNTDQCSGSSYNVGQHVTGWIACTDALEWKRFDGTIQLSND